MAAEPDQDRNEAASPHKLDEARKRGQVARSTDLVSAVVFCAAVGYLYLRGLSTLEQQFRLDRMLLSQAGGAADASSVGLWRLIESAARESLAVLAPLLLALMLAAVVGSLAQTGGVFSLQQLAPDWSRLNPVEGLKRVLSLRTLFDTFRAVAKLVILVVVMYLALRALVPHFHQLAAASPHTFLRQLLSDAATAGLKMALALMVIAAIDFAFTRHEFAKKMRMSRREMRDESKQREGDPRIRARLRELRREVLKRSLAVRNTKHADLLLTNPTHVAVALSYRHGQMVAPKIVAKGAGLMAAQMRGIAHRHAIPVVPRPELARALYAQAAIGADLPDAYYGEVAQLMIWVITMRQARNQAASSSV